ncbi:hypothetical protein P8452_16874 [Trifolium repens]|nr:hypothetical protein P8452_16874 [Trifolium repens]
MGRRPPKTPPPSRLPKIVKVTIDQLFDPEYATKYGTTTPVDWDDRETIHDLTKCAKLALADYNIQTRKDYRFVNIEMATWQSSSVCVFHITFKARNAQNNKCTTFQATTHHNRHMRMVKYIRIKGRSTG